MLLLLYLSLYKLWRWVSACGILHIGNTIYEVWSQMDIYVPLNLRASLILFVSPSFSTLGTKNLLALIRPIMVGSKATTGSLYGSDRQSNYILNDPDIETACFLLYSSLKKLTFSSDIAVYCNLMRLRKLLNINLLWAFKRFMYIYVLPFISEKLT